jgi:ABC-type Fe3+/spermidine/putrescine transport system ATPase subunit
VAFPLRSRWRFPAGAAVVIAVRPEKLTISQNAASGNASAEARVLTAVYLGDRSQIKLTTASTSVPITAAPGAAGNAHRIGDSVFVSLNPDGALLFPA